MEQLIIYRYIVKDERFSASDKIVYSYLVYRSLGKIINISPSSTGIKPKVADFVKYSERFIDTWGGEVKELAATLGLSRKKIYETISRLSKMGILMDGKIWISKDIQDGYFNLYTSDALIGLQAIVYSYLKAKFDKYGVIDTLHNKMAQELGLSQKSFSSVVNNLQKCDYIRFQRTGRRVNIIVNPLPIRSEEEPHPAIIPASPDIRPEPVMMFPRYISPIEELQMRAARGQDVQI